MVQPHDGTGHVGERRFRIAELAAFAVDAVVTAVRKRERGAHEHAQGPQQAQREEHGQFDIGHLDLLAVHLQRIAHVHQFELYADGAERKRHGHGRMESQPGREIQPLGRCGEVGDIETGPRLQAQPGPGRRGRKGRQQQGDRRENASVHYRHKKEFPLIADVPRRRRNPRDRTSWRSIYSAKYRDFS